MEGLENISATDGPKDLFGCGPQPGGPRPKGTEKNSVLLRPLCKRPQPQPILWTRLKYRPCRQKRLLPPAPRPSCTWAGYWAADREFGTKLGAAFGVGVPQDRLKTVKTQQQNVARIVKNNT